MAINLTNFLLSLASAIAVADGSFALGTTLFVHQADEGVGGADASVGYAVLRIYGGPEPSELRPVNHVAIQVQATALDAGTALGICQRVYEALAEPADIAGTGIRAGRPRCYWDLAGKQLSGAGAVIDDAEGLGWHVRLLVLRQPPGAFGRNQAGAYLAGFNFEVRFSRDV